MADNSQTPDNTEGQVVEETTPTPEVGQGQEPAQEGTGQAEQQPQEKIDYAKQYENLRKDYTRKTQRLSELEKQQEALSKDPLYKQYQEDKARLEKLKQGQADFRDWENMSEQERAEYQLKQFVSPIISEKLQQDEYVQKLEQRLQALEGYTQQSYQQRAAEQWEAFKKQNPDAVNLADDIAKTIEQYNVPLDKAYLFVKAEKGQLTAEGKQAALQDMSIKEKANLEMPTTKPSSPEPKKGMTFEEAVKLAEDKVGAKLG